jgi:hypothetical protein
MMSGGPIRKFTEGWAVRVFGWGAAHYFIRDAAGLAHAVCGAGSVPVTMLRGLGNWRQCKRCLYKKSLAGR